MSKEKAERKVFIAHRHYRYNAEIARHVELLWQKRFDPSAPIAILDEAHGDLKADNLERGGWVSGVWGKIITAPPEIGIPPAWAVSLLTLFAGSRRAEATIGDLNERFTSECTEFGLSRARLLYSVRALRSVWPLLQRMLVRLGVWAAIISAVKRYFVG